MSEYRWSSINLHIAEIRSIEQIAAALFVSREYLSRRFTQSIGIPIGKYITKKRIELAKKLLSQRR